jgi:quinol monooxygenase YgiN
MTWLLVKFKIQDGKQAEFEGVLRDLAAKVRANEPGVPTYTLVKKQGDANATEYWMIENYKDAASLQAHGQTDYFKAAGPKFMGCLAGAPDVQMLEVVV